MTAATAAPAIEGFRLSPQQRRTWQLARDSRAFKVQALVEIQGGAEAATPEAVRAALTALVARHEILRTTYRRSPGVRFPLQVVAAELPPLWQVAPEGSDPAALFDKALARPFDLERGPVVHATWVPGGPGRAALILALPSIAADARSLDAFLAELERELATQGDAEEPVQYVQVSEWANELIASEESRAGREHFRTLPLTSLFALSLPLEKKVPGGFAPERVAVALAPETAERVATLAASLGVEERSLLLAAWCALLARMSGSVEVGVGVELEGRSHPDLADALGAFARTAPLVAQAADGKSIASLAPEIEAALSEAIDWQDCFSTEEDDRYGIGFPASFSYRARSAAIPSEGGAPRLACTRRVANVERTKLGLEVDREPGHFTCSLVYDGRVFSSEVAATHAERWGAYLAALLCAPETPIGDPDLLTERERLRFAELNATAAAYPTEATVDSLFFAQAARTPEKLAVKMGEAELTYGDLAGRVERLARHLAARGARPGRLVAILSERSIDMAVGILAVLRAGAAYLPLDSAYPSDRIAFMLDDSGADLVLAQESLLSLLAPERATAAGTLVLGDAGDGGETSGAVGTASPADLAYVLYTSGSTGKPKGVMVPHGGVVNYLHWAIGAYDAGSGVTPLHSPIGFDLTVTSLFAPLLSGGAVELLADERGIEALAETLREKTEYALTKLTPAHLGLLGPIAADGEPAAWARTLIVGGEALLGEALAPWTKRSPEVRIANEYGPTETVVGCSAFIVRAGAIEPGPVPIGRPIANARLHLLDGRGRAVPEGVPGEIYIGGAGVARGYLGRPDLTAERFVPDPFAAEPGARLYRSGDLARLMPTGDLEFLGRNDHQVKVRGVRLELGEIEATLLRAPGVRETAVLAREDRPGERRLVAYFTSDRDPAPNVDELRRHLAATLPDAMVPALFLRLATLPLTANGKLDRPALPAPGNARPELEREYVAPRNETEATLVEIWGEVLSVDRIGVEDNFFALGGDSIRSVRVIALAREKGIELTVEELFRHPTVAALAEHAASAGSAAAAANGAEAKVEDEAELAELLAELEGLSDEEVAARLQGEEAAKS